MKRVMLLLALVVALVGAGSVYAAGTGTGPARDFNRGFVTGCGYGPGWGHGGGYGPGWHRGGFGPGAGHMSFDRDGRDFGPHGHGYGYGHGYGMGPGAMYDYDN